MNIYEEKSAALISAIQDNDFVAASSLAVEVVPTMLYSLSFDEDIVSDNDEALLSLLTNIISGDLHEETTHGQFELAKVVIETAWNQPLSIANNKIREHSSSFCKKYIEHISEEDNIEIRNCAVDYFDGEVKVRHLGQMIAYLIKDTERYSLAWDKLDQLEKFSKSEALLFKSHMLRHGLGVRRNAFDALIAEIQSAKLYLADNAKQEFHYGYYYGILANSELLFAENASDKSLEMNRSGFIWYASQTQTSDPFAVAIRELKSIGALDENRERLY